MSAATWMKLRYVSNRARLSLYLTLRPMASFPSRSSSMYGISTGILANVGAFFAPTAGCSFRHTAHGCITRSPPTTDVGPGKGTSDIIATWERRRILTAPSTPLSISLGPRRWPAATTPRRRPCRLPPRIHTGAGAVPHAADPLHAIRPMGGDRLGATHRVDLRRAKGPPASRWSTFAYSNSVSISSSPILARSRRWSSSRASGARLFRPACPAARN